MVAADRTAAAPREASKADVSALTRVGSHRRRARINTVSPGPAHTTRSWRPGETHVGRLG